MRKAQGGGGVERGSEGARKEVGGRQGGKKDGSEEGRKDASEGGRE